MGTEQLGTRPGSRDVVRAARRGHGVRGRAAELRLLGARERAGAGAVRELLALQSSDWAFLVSEALAPPYGRERFDGHLEGLRRALADARDGDPPAGPRNIAVDARPGTLLAPL